MPAGKAYNLANSVLYFNLAYSAGGAAGRFNWLPVDQCPAIQRIQLYTRGGVNIADITNLHRYLNLVQKVEMRNERLANRSVVNFLYPNNSLPTTAPALRPSTSTGALVQPSTKAYVEPSYAIVGGDNTATPSQLFQLNLGDIPHSIFSLDKDLYFNY